MEYLGAFQYPFRSPRWGTNLFYGSLLMLIPLVGPIALLGYLGEASDLLLKDRNAAPPDLDFNRFGKYLERGVWPFLATFLASFAMVAFVFLAMSPTLAIPLLKLEGPAAVVPVILAVVLGIVGAAFSIILMTGVALHAMESRKLDVSAWPGFLKDFTRRVGIEAILVQVFIFLAGIPLAIAGYACCFVGVFPATTLLQFAHWFLIFQLYELYMERGGMPIGLVEAPDDWLS